MEVILNRSEGAKGKMEMERNRKGAVQTEKGERTEFRDE